MANTTVKGKFNVVAENGDVQTIYPKTTGDQVLVDRSSNASVIPNDVANLQHIVNKMGSLALKSKVETSDFTTGTMISSLEDLKSNTDTGKIADATVVKDIESRVDTLENSNLVTVDELDAGLATKPDTEINDSVTSTSLTWSSKKLSDQLTTLNSNTQLLNSRVDGLSTLQEGSTTGDAELIGIRTGYDSTNYNSAGDAVRTQFENVYKSINTLKAGILGIDNSELTWRSGGINGDSGDEYSTNWEIRSNYFKFYTNINSIKIKCETGYQGKLLKYDNTNEYIGFISFSAGENEVIVNSLYKYRLTLRSTSSTITVDECTNILFSEYDLFNDIRDIYKSIDNERSINNSIMNNRSYIINIEWEIGSFSNDTGEKIKASNILRSRKKINVDDINKIYVKKLYSEYPHSIAIRYYMYDSNNNYLGYTLSYNTIGTLNENTKYINIYLSDYITSTNIAYADGFEFYTYYEPSILDRCSDQIENIYIGCGYNRYEYNKKNFAILMISDLHNDTERLKDAITLLNNCDALDACINLGDMFGASPGDATSYINIINQSKKPFLTVLGNHDERVYENTNISINTAVSNYINLTNDKLCYEPRGYGYKDFDTYKIRLIILNSFDYPDIKDINDKYIYYGSYCMYLENQISWLISTLTSTPNDYTVIIASHYVEPCVIDETKIAVHKETKHRSDSGANAGGLGIMSDTIISDIIDAYKNKTILSKNYTYNNAKYNIINGITNDININADFSSSSGKFACYICGHVHNQQIGVISNHTDQVVYFNDSSRNITNDPWTTAYSIIPKTKSGKSQNLMTVLCVDTDNKNLNFIRIGAYLSIYMEDYSFLNYKYFENL